MDYSYIYFPEIKFGGFSDIDGTIRFYIRVNSLIDSSSVVLDVGCGNGSRSAEDPIPIRKSLRVLKGKCKKVIGIDVDKACKDNSFIDEFGLIENNKWPLKNESVDVCVCHDVLEHIENPDLFFSELHRVIKKGGYVCISTPNILNYVSLFSKLIPNRFHFFVLDKIQNKRKERDVFPTFYKCNRKKKISFMLDKYCFTSYVYGHEGKPNYLVFSRFLFFLGVIHQRFMPNMFKQKIFAFGKKR
jgi:SAM-dependent methyltransferase